MHKPQRSSTAGSLALRQPAATILAVLPSTADQEHLRTLLAGSSWTLQCVASMREALGRLWRNPSAVLISNDELPDGNWLDLQREAATFERAPVVVVASRIADEGLWLKVLDSGAFDLLAKPLERDEVLAVLDAARRTQRRSRKPEARRPGSAGETLRVRAV